MNYTRIILLIILISTSLKAQWDTLNSNYSRDNVQVFFVDENIGFIITMGDLLKTTDGGKNWDRIQFFGTEYSIFFINENIGFIAALDGVKKTTDGGLTWTTYPEFSNLLSIHFVDDRIGFAAGYGRIIKTADHGDTWNVFHDGYTFTNVFATNPYTIYAFGFLAWDNFGFKSIDGGMTWQTLNMGYDFRFRHSFFINPEVGYVIGSDLGTSFLIKTIDGGNSWQLILQSQKGLSSIYFTDLNTGYLVGGYVFGGSQPILWKTTDGGLTWEDQNPENNVSDAIYSIHFVNDCVGYAVGENGLILKTINAGDSTLCKEIPPIPPPPKFRLNQNYPNPFNNYTIIKYDLPVDSNINLVVYNLGGQKIRTLIDTFQTAGEKEITWNGTDDNGKTLSSGLYIYILKINKHTLCKKLLFLK